MANQPQLRAVATANTEFTSDLFNALRKRMTENLIFSPYSVSAVVAMVKAGARGQTSTDIQNAFKFPGDTQLHNGFKELIGALKKDRGSFTLETVNKIYAKEGYKINGEYLDTVSKHYGASVEQLDFSNSTASAEHINDFVAKTTHDKIKNIMAPQDFNSLTRLILINAIYFKGSWVNKFPPRNTKGRDFNLNKKDTVKIKMMTTEDDFLFAEIKELNARAILLPYKGGRVSMLILIPKDIEGLSQMEEKLKNVPLPKIFDRLREREIELTMPKFRIESTIDLKYPLKELGAGSMFEQSAADFSGISKEKPFFVSKVVQKAFIEVNELGTEAAAVTVCGSVGGSAPGPVIPPLKVVIDRPFLFNIIWNAKEPTRGRGPESKPVPVILFQGTFIRPKSCAIKKPALAFGKTKR